MVDQFTSAQTRAVAEGANVLDAKGYSDLAKQIRDILRGPPEEAAPKKAAKKAEVLE